MCTHPHIAAAFAADRQRELLAQADAYRLARAATRRPRDSRSPAIASRLALIIRRAATAVAARTPRTT
jgi:hypothetical protein